MIVYLFPGQGSQQVGMGSDLVSTPQGKAAFEQAREVLGYDLSSVCQQGPAEELQRTLYTQPALYVVGCILVDVLRDRGINPGAVAGHSAGEYAALYAAGVYDFRTGMEIVARRASLMDEAGRRAGGAMAAIVGMDAAAVENLVSDCIGKGILGVAAYNAAAQTVISGEKEQVEAAAAEARKRGARMAKVLAVSGAFHSRLMSDAAGKFADYLEQVELKSPKVPFVSNLTGVVETEPAQIRQGLAKLLEQPVRWTACLQTLASLLPEAYYEMGPGSVLAGLLKKFDAQAKVVAMDCLESLEKQLS